MDISARESTSSRLMTRLRAWLLGIEPEQFLAIQMLLKGYRGSMRKGNSVIMGGPTSWSWQATIDDTHHGSRGSGLHADSHARQHALSSGDDHTGEITDLQHGSRGSGLHADSHARQHAMDSASDHSAGVAGDVLRAGVAGAWERLGIGAASQVLTVVGGAPAWADPPATAEHGNEKHNPDFYPLNGSEALTAPLAMHLMAPVDEPTAVVGNEGKLYYLTPGGAEKGVIKQIMKNSTGAFERVQLAIST